MLNASSAFHHPQVGPVTLGFQGMQLEDTPGQRLGVYLADPGTADYDAMILPDPAAPRCRPGSTSPSRPNFGRPMPEA